MSLSGPCVEANYDLVQNGGIIYYTVGQAHSDVVQLENEYEIVKTWNTNHIKQEILISTERFFFLKYMNEQCMHSCSVKALKIEYT